ncbi:hypothetical protein Q9L58_009617 [Maublancomyces gigas]|uniref:U1-type domain-containing protein n=1 Tax=Discina gigas TaxID=1032678 RepID=A0ABR3G6D6_9PEZI
MDLQPANTDWYLDPNGAPSSTWTCHLCTRTMNIFHRDSHLYSRRHLRAARVDAPPAPPPPQPFMWQCVPCGVDMNVFHRDAHLGSKQHARNTLPAAISHCLICNTVVQVEVQSGGESRLSVCVDCDGLFRDREHVDGGGEQGAEEEVGIDPGDTAEYDSDSNRDGNTDAQYDNINAYPATTPGPVQPDHPPREDDNCLYCSRAMSEGHMCGVITCEVCGVWMSRRYQAVHQFTMRHRTAVQESERRQQEDSADSDVQNEENTSPGGRHARAPEYLPQRQHVGCPHCVTTIEDEYPYFFLKSQATTHGVYCRCTICRAQSQEAVATDNHAGVEKWWTCTLCSRTMRMGSREGHLTLATHHARAQGMMKQRKGVEMFHRKLKKSKQVKAKWECELCGKEMGLGAKESHLNSRKHRKKETQMERGKGKNVIIPEPVSNNQNISAQRKKQQGEILTREFIVLSSPSKLS